MYGSFLYIFVSICLPNKFASDAVNEILLCIVSVEDVF